MSRLESRDGARFVVIGTPEDRRVVLFQEALERLGRVAAQIVSYRELLAGEVALAEALTPETVVRIESPGKSSEIERQLIALGAEESDPEGECYERISPSELAAIPDEKGRLLPSRQWYLGFSVLMRRLAGELATAKMMNVPEEILLMFDKRRCHALLEGEGISVPEALEPVGDYDELMEALRGRGWSRVFLKLAHGSSAAGTVAYRFSGQRHQAFTTVEVVEQGGELRLYNTRRIRCLESRREIAQVVNALCRQRVHVERWLPKPMYEGRVFDLRVVVIGGQAMHSVVRMSRSPMTNLHLLNRRGNLAEVRQRIGEEYWQGAMESCERAARLFGGLYTGVDLLFSANYRQHAILEMNAFGDLLPGLLYRDMDTYTAEIVAVLGG